MADDRLFLTLDQGGHASRALVFDVTGKMLVQAFAEIGTRREEDGRVEHDAEEIIRSLTTVIGDAAGQMVRLGEKRPISAVGLATQRSSIVCWDRQTGSALSPVISWQDRRNAALVESLRPHAAKIHELTGLVLSPHYGASKLRWCLDNLPAVQEAVRTDRLAFGPLSSFILFRLLAERPFVVDPANASRTQLWSPTSAVWAPELLKLFGIPAQYLPQPVQSHHRYGTLTFGTRKAPLVACTGDQSTVPFAFETPQRDTAYINMGTGAFILRPLHHALIAPPLLSSILWSQTSLVLSALEGTVNGAGSALDWFSKETGADTTQMIAALDTQAGPDPDPANPLLFLNGVSGLGSPFWAANFPSRFENDSAARSAEERLRAILDSIVFLIRVNLDEMQRHSPPFKRIVITGGLASSDVLCQKLASLTGLPVARYDEREATARGLAFLTADRPYHWPASVPQVFGSKSDDPLSERFALWLRAMKQTLSA